MDSWIQCSDSYRGEPTSFTSPNLWTKWDFHQELPRVWYVNTNYILTKILNSGLPIFPQILRNALKTISSKRRHQETMGGISKIIATLEIVKRLALSDHR